MEEYPCNSYKSREERNAAASSEKKVEKIISGSAKPKKKDKIQKFMGAFLSEDVDNLKTYILWDVLVPLIKKGISEAVSMVLYGEAGQTRKSPSGTKVSYGKFYDRESDRRNDCRTSIQNVYDYDDIIFETRGDAESVLDAMNDIISQYGVVSVGDLYDLADISVNNYNIHKYGWADIGGSRVIRVRDGYVLKLPKALPIN